MAFDRKQLDTVQGLVKLSSRLGSLSTSTPTSLTVIFPSDGPGGTPIVITDQDTGFNGILTAVKNIAASRKTAIETQLTNLGVS